MWVRYFGVPVHAWTPELFSSLVKLFGSYMCSDDNTKKKKAMDVARFLVRTDSFVAVKVLSRLKSIRMCLKDGVMEYSDW